MRDARSRSTTRPARFALQLIFCLVAALLNACGGGDGGTTQPPGQTGTLSVTLVPTSVSISVGGTSVVALQITRGGGFSGAVSLSVGGLPSGVTGTLTPASLDASLSGGALTLVAGSGTTAGTSTITVSASGSGVSTATASLQLTITQGSFTLTALPTSLTVAAGASAASTITIARAGGFTGAVAFSVVSPPTGITLAFSPASVTGTTSSVTVSIASTVAAGAYTVNILGQGAGAADKSIAIPVNVTAAQTVGFSLTVDPVEFDLPAGRGWTGNGIVTIARSNGFTGAVTISVAPFSGGGTAAFAGPSPQTIAVGSTSTNLLALTFDGAAPGVYSATVKASAAGFADQVVPVRIRVSPPSTGAVSWRFCNASRVPKYFAVRDGATGAWQHITPDGPAAASATTATTFSFSLTQPVAAVAFINLGEKTSASSLIEGHDWKVYYMTAQEITELAAQECTRFPDVNARTSSLTVTGYTGFDLVLANVSANNLQYSASTGQASTTFALSNLQPGAFDLIVSRSTSLSGNFLTMQSLSLQRGLTPANGVAIPAVNLATVGVAPVAASVTVGNTNSETFFSTQTFMTAAGLNGLMATSGSFSTNTRPWWGVPVDRTIAGDLHQLVLTTAVGAPRRAVITYARSVSTRSIDFGPVLGAPTVTAGANGAPAWIVRATGTLSADYVNRASLYLRESFADPRTMTVVATRGFLGAGGAYDIAVPDLTAASGFTFFWNFHRSTGVAWTVTGGEGDPGGPNEASCMLSGVCTVKAIDGATYKSAQAIGTVTVP